MSMMASGLSSAAPGQRVGEDQAALGVGVEDLDGRAAVDGDHVAGALGGAAGHVLGDGTPAVTAHRQAELGEARARRRAPPPRPPCRTSSRPSPSAGLSEMPPVSKVMPLPTSARCAVAPAGWYSRRVSRGGFARALAHGEDAAAAVADEVELVPDRHGDRQAGDRVGRGGGQHRRRQRVGGRVDQVAGEVDGCGHRGDVLDGLLLLGGGGGRQQDGDRVDRGLAVLLGRAAEGGEVVRAQEGGDGDGEEGLVVGQRERQGDATDSAPGTGRPRRRPGGLPPGRTA